MFRQKPNSVARALVFAALPLCFSAPQAFAQNPVQVGSSAAKPGAPVLLQRSDADIFAATLAGRYAQGVDNPKLAAQAWARAFFRRPSDLELYDRATAANLEVGNLGMVVRMAKLVAPAQRSPKAVLALTVEALGQGRYQDVARTLDGQKFSPSLTQFANHLRAYALLGQGQGPKAIDLASQVTGISELDDAALMSRAMILARAKRPQEAIALFEKARGLQQDSPAGLRFYSQLLLSVGQRDKAEALLSPLAERGSVKASAFTGALALARAGDKGNVALNAQDHVAIGMLTLVEAMQDSRPPTETSDLLFLLAFLHPSSDEVNAALGQHLASHGYDELAEPLLERVSVFSPDFVATRTELAWLIYTRDPNQALLNARELVAKNPTNFAAMTLLADMLSANRLDAEAEAAYHSLIKQGEAANWSPAETWPLYFGRGGARERLGRWPEALSDLRLAKAAAPNQPNVLNYLGYALADRGENLDEALAMLRNAMRLRPRSGAILDSYGWALFKSGRHEEAATMLERAASLAPNLAEVADHLGDVYWRTGRQEEARLEWRRALSLTPTAEQTKALEIKLSDGLPPDPSRAADAAILAQTKSN
ncbi:tetratricopeptide repeat protein [Aquidulcibacter sp.]|uniref:tetratricopeptide repeat protein n=1 Tax=Aquidulcibacter sp. TaxID=2052990 RepID=UPI003BA7D124